MPASTIELDTSDGPMPVFEADPDAPATRGVVVVQDVFGVTGYLEGVATDLAGGGWVALAPHLYHRDGSPVTPFDQFPRAQGHLRSLTGSGILADLDACFIHLASLGILPARRAVIGFCMGGTVAHFAAIERSLGAAVTFYGQAAASGWEGVPPAMDRAAGLQVPWLGLFGADDPLVPVADVERLRQAAARAPAPTRVITYPGADHAFHRAATPDTFHPEVAAEAWRECTTWLDTYIPISEPLALSRPEHTQP